MRGIGYRLGCGIGMPEYRAYALGRDGHIFNSAALICDNDVEAIEQAKTAFDNAPVELWSGARFIVRLEHPGRPDHPR